MANKIRTFVALPIPGEVTGFIEQIQKQLHASRVNIRWVPVANIHLTLKFLGDIDVTMIPAIKAQLDAASRSTAPLTLTAEGGGVFPKLRQARVLWVGLTGDIKQLELLQNNIESGFASLGFKHDHRPFRAHLTIGRVRQRPDPKTLGELLDLLKEKACEPFDIDQIRLYQSVLKPSGAEYTLLHAASLAALGVTTRQSDK